jgi:hypothetical protein
MTTAEAAELLELKAFRRRLLVFRRHIIAVLAFRALQHDIITRHKPSYLFPICDFRLPICFELNRQLTIEPLNLLL